MKLLIADDEDLVLDGLTYLVSEAGLDWDTRTARNGQEAYEIAVEWHPDVLITDVRMPVCNGLELCRRLKAAGHLPITLIISGYEDFEYARTAIDYGVEGYLLKPVQQEEVIRRFLDLDARLLRRHREERQERRHHRYALRKMLVDLVRDELSLEGAARAFGESIERFRIDGVTMVVILADRLRERATSPLGTSRRTLDAILVSLEEAFETAIATENELGEIVLLVSGANVSADGVDRIEALIETKVGTYASRCSGICAGNFADIHRIYVTAFVRAFVCECAPGAPNHLRASIHCDDPGLAGTGRPVIDYPFLKSHIGSFVAAVRDGGASRIHSAIEGLAAAVDADDVDAGQRRFVMWLTRQVMMSSRELQGLTADRSPSDEASTGALQYERESDGGADDVRAVLASLVRSGPRGDRGNRIIARGIERIRADLKNASLRSVADELRITPVYLSTLFKEKTGENFRDYLARCRVEHAMDRLRDPTSRVSEIASELGYSEPKHFAAMFKRHAGMTPSQYRASI
ncbi:MAG: response regulator transcription factor [bacterium]